MFSNPFKKKDNEFKLDDYSLPSLGETPSSDLPELPQTNSIQTDSVSSLSDEELISQTPKYDSVSNQSPFPSSPEPQVQLAPAQNNDNLHQDITKAKLDTIDTKMALMEAKMSSMEQKMEMIYQMLASEVSEETKRKLKIDSMMGRIRE